MANETVIDAVLDIIEKIEKRNTSDTKDSIANMDRLTDSFFNSVQLVEKSLSKLVDNIDTFTKRISSINQIIFDTKSINKIIDSNKSTDNVVKNATRLQASVNQSMNKYMSSTKNYISMFFNGITSALDGLMSAVTKPLKSLANIITKPFQAITSMVDSFKKKIQSFKDMLSNPIGTIMENKKNRDEELKAAGVSKLPLSEAVVLKKTAAGVAVFWLYKELSKGKTVKAIEGNENTNWLDTAADTSMAVDGFSKLLKTKAARWLLNIVKSPWFYGTALIAAGAATTYFLGKQRIKEMEKRGETPESVLNVKKATGYQKAVVKGSEAIAGNVGKGTFKERAVNAVKNAGWGGAIGALVGGGLGAFAGPGGVAAGAVLGAKLGVAIGASTGFVGGKDLAKGINAATESVKGLVIASKAEAATMENASQTAEQFSNAQNEYVKKITAQNAAIANSEKTIKLFNKNLKETNDKALPSLWDKIKEFFFGSKMKNSNSNNGSIDQNYTKRTKSNESPYKEPASPQHKSPKSKEYKEARRNVPPTYAPLSVEERAQALIKNHEGFSGKLYRDPVSGWNIGYAHQVSKAETSKYANGITKEEAERLFNKDYSKFKTNIQNRWEWTKQLDPVRMAALTNMGYQMGIGELAKFTPTLEALRKGDYSKIIDNSKNWKVMQQTGFRTRHNVALLTTGDEYLLSKEFWKLNRKEQEAILSSRMAAVKNGTWSAHLASTKESPKTNIAKTSAVINEAKKENAEKINDSIVKSITSLTKEIKSIKTEKTSNKEENKENTVKAIENIHSIPQHIMQLMFGMNVGGENNSFGII